jgi:hypothetical protein
MAGDDLVRFCTECKRYVYNFSALQDKEIEEIVSRREGRLCARFYQLTDGTMVTRSRVEGVRRTMWRLSGVATAALAAMASIAPAMALPSTTGADSLIQIEAAQTGLLIEVVDSAGASVPQALVTAINEKTAAKIEARTDASGRAGMSDVPPGIYSIEISASSFETQRLSHIVLPVQKTLKVTMRVAFTGEVVSIHKPNPIRRFFSALGRIFSE